MITSFFINEIKELQEYQSTEMEKDIFNYDHQLYLANIKQELLLDDEKLNTLYEKWKRDDRPILVKQIEHIENQFSEIVSEWNWLMSNENLFHPNLYNHLANRLSKKQNSAIAKRSELSNKLVEYSIKENFQMAELNKCLAQSQYAKNKLASINEVKESLLNSDKLIVELLNARESILI